MRGFTFPSHYPENCPPDVNDAIFGIFYRIVYYQDRIRRKDFLSRYEKSKINYLDKNFNCEQRATSLFREKGDAEDVLKNHPRMHTRCIAQINIPIDYGVIDHCPDEGRLSHHNWWIPNEVNIEEIEVISISDPY
jgi:hypothetical protein